MNNTVVVIVHHKSTETIGRTVESIVTAGVAVEDILVVDNSEDVRLIDGLRHLLPAGIGLAFIENRGYGNAVNHALRMIDPTKYLYTVVCTHEVVLEPDALARMLAAMTEGGHQLAAAGPTVLRAGSDRLWSLGGSIGRWTGRPTHIKKAAHPRTQTEHRDWLDGAVVLYRTHDLKATLFREDFFLYFEETDCHARLRGRGLGVVWVRDATVSQQTSGAPPYLYARNLVIFLRAHGSRTQRAFGPLVVLGGRAFKATVQERSTDTVSLLLRGWRDGRRNVDLQPGQRYDDCAAVRARAFDRAKSARR